MKKVSIIVPVYHVENYLRECIDSILNQSYRNIELILVDDGGDDNCPLICDEYRLKDNRVKCIHKKNEGQSMGRKEGLLVSSGQYIMYVDADDWLETDAVRACVEVAEKTNAEVVCFGYKRIYEKKVFRTSLFDTNRDFLEMDVKLLHRRMVGMIGRELERVEEADRLVTMWGKLYTREVAQAGIFVSERKVGSSEDAIYNLGAFEECYKCVYINQFLYNYRKISGSTSTSVYRKELPIQWEKLFDYFKNYIMENNCASEYEDALQNRIALSLLGLGLNELGNKQSFFTKAKNLRTILKKPQWKSAYEQLQFEYFPFKWKVFYGLCKYQQTELLVILLFIISKMKSKVSK